MACVGIIVHAKHYIFCFAWMVLHRKYLDSPKLLTKELQRTIFISSRGLYLPLIMDSIRDFSSSSPKKISCKVIAVSNSIETEGGRTSVFVQDYQYRECCTYLMSFHDDNETIVNEIQINGIYIIRNARLDVNNRKESHYPFRLVHSVLFLSKWDTKKTLFL